MLKPGGHFCVSDIVLEGELPAALAEAAIAYAGCVAGAQNKDEYMATIKPRPGSTMRPFAPPARCICPISLLVEVLGAEAAAGLKDNGFGIYSITVVGLQGIRGPMTRSRPYERFEPRLWRYELPGGWIVLAGKNDQDNDHLSLKMAKANDYWFHVKGLPGSHVLLRVPAGQEP